jgi:hypothetical protein
MAPVSEAAGLCTPPHIFSDIRTSSDTSLTFDCCPSRRRSFRFSAKTAAENRRRSPPHRSRAGTRVRFACTGSRGACAAYPEESAIRSASGGLIIYVFNFSTSISSLWAGNPVAMRKLLTGLAKEFIEIRRDFNPLS